MAKPQITTKNLEELSELMDSESLAYSKCCAYSQIACDEVLKSKLSSLAGKHKARFEGLLGYLNSHE